jgi:hypothetical protein
MTHLIRITAALAACAAIAGSAVAGQYIYPTKGQSAEQQNKDSYECYGWAKAQSGVDPGAPPPPIDRGQRAGSTVGGAARGAALGAAVGGIAGNAGKGAAAGAVVGGARGRRRGIEAEHAQAAETRSAYDRAFAACMEGRGYTVR